MAEEEGLRKLTDKEIKQIGDKLGDNIEWYEAVRMMIADAVPNSTSKRKKKGGKHHDC